MRKTTWRLESIAWKNWISWKSKFESIKRVSQTWCDGLMMWNTKCVQVLDKDSARALRAVEKRHLNELQALMVQKRLAQHHSSIRKAVRIIASPLMPFVLHINMPAVSSNGTQMATIRGKFNVEFSTRPNPFVQFSNAVVGALWKWMLWWQFVERFRKVAKRKKVGNKSWCWF